MTAGTLLVKGGHLFETGRPLWIDDPSMLRWMAPFLSFTAATRCRAPSTQSAISGRPTVTRNAAYSDIA